MRHDDHFFKANDDLELYQQRWLPEGPACAAVAVVHGVVEHGGRYAWLAERLTAAGYAVYVADLRGHGRSEGPRLYVESFDQYLDDLDVFLSRLRATEPDKPVFLLGHSMGGAIASLYAAGCRPGDLAGLVLSAPAVRIGGGVYPLLRRLARVLDWIAPRLRLVQLGGGYISRDPEVIEQFRNDPLVCKEKLPVRTAAELMRATRRLELCFSDIQLPLLAMHGTGDVVTNAEGSRRLYAAAGSSDKTLRLYEGLYHELFSEPERDQVVGDLLTWLGERSPCDASSPPN